MQKLCSSGFCAVETLPSNACYRRAQADFGARHPGVEEAWARAKGRGPRTIKPKPVIAPRFLLAPGLDLTPWRAFA